MTMIPDLTDRVSLVIEIVSCRDLWGEDPFVKVSLGDKQVHKTSHIAKSFNPTYSLKTNSTFVFNDFAEEIIENDGFNLQITNNKRIGQDSVLGNVLITPEEIWTMMDTSEETEFAILPIQDSPNKPTRKLSRIGSKGSREQFKVKNGFITVKIRPAVSKDRVQFDKTERYTKPYWKPTSYATSIGSFDSYESAEEEVLEYSDPSIPKVTDRLSLKIEIVSCRDLIAMDYNASDPYVMVALDDTNTALHKTEYISKTLNPIYTLKTDSTFVYNGNVEKLMKENGFQFRVMDWDMIGHNDKMGHVCLTPEEIWTMAQSSEEKEFLIIPPSDIEGKEAGYMTLRIQHATSDDRDQFQAKQSANVTYWMPPPPGDPSYDPPPLVANIVANIDLTEPTSNDLSYSPVVDEEDDSIPKATDRVSLRIEIVSCRDLLAGDLTSSDPYVKVDLGDTDLHKTKRIVKTLNPVYSLKTNSTFVFNRIAGKIVKENGLQFIIKDWDMIGKNDRLGHIRLTPKEVWAMAKSSSKKEFSITPPSSSNKEEAGFISIRIKYATPNDRVQFHADEQNVVFWKPPGKEVSLVLTPSYSGEQASLSDVSLDDDNLDVGIIPKGTDRVSLLIQIVSCRDLATAESSELSDLYVIVTMGGVGIHKSKRNKTTNPVDFVEMNSSFVYNGLAHEIIERQGLEFQIMDYDKVGRDTSLGRKHLSPKKIWSMSALSSEKEFSVDLPLRSLRKFNKGKAGFITIRIQHATIQHRIQFNSGISDTYWTPASLPPPQREHTSPPPPPPPPNEEEEKKKKERRRKINERYYNAKFKKEGGTPPPNLITIKKVDKEDPDNNENKKPSYTNTIVSVIGFVGFIGLLVVLGLYLVKGEVANKDVETKSRSIAFNPTLNTSKRKDVTKVFLSPPPPPIMNEGRRYELLVLLTLNDYTSLDDLETPGTPQNYALWWLSDQDTTTKLPKITHYLRDDNDLVSLHLLQRYTLAVLYYSTRCGGDDNDTENHSFREEVKNRQVQGDMTTSATDLNADADNNNWHRNKNWMTDKNICDWYGVSCEGNIIEALNLVGNNLRGTIPSELATLNIHTLDLANNHLYGTIPSKFFSSLVTSGLGILSLDDNQLTGTISIPPQPKKQQQLYEISLSYNKLTGPLDFMTNLSKDLTYLYLDNNQFTGTIPSSELPPLLQHWSICNNRLTGTLPPALFLMPSFQNNIKSFQFNSNLNLFGTLPTEIGLLTKLELLEGDTNEFTGTIPSEIGQLEDLKHLQLNHNPLHGKFPNRNLCKIPIIFVDCDENNGGKTDNDNTFYIQDCYCCKFCNGNENEGISA